MKDSTIIIIVVGVAALLFWAVSSGIIKTVGGPIQVGNTGIVAPQPTSNYSGYLAATTAPGISGALNQSISGLSNLFSGWLGSQNNPTPKTGQTFSPSSPAVAAQPSGPAPTSGAALVASLNPGVGSSYASYADTLVGPQVPSDTAYSATNGSAFDYSGLSADNAYDPSYSLQDPFLA